jgi:PAS domain S-box-containing protein
LRMNLFSDFITNFALLIVLLFAYSRIFYHFHKHKPYNQILNGFIFGIISICVMSLPVHLMPGLIFDTRSIIISIAGLFGGPIAAIIVVPLSIAYRIYQGGTGMFVGVAVIITSAILGVIYYYLRKKYPSAMDIKYIYIFGLTVHIVMLLCMFILPFDLAIKTIRAVGVPVILAYPIISWVIIIFLNGIEHEVELEESFRNNLYNYQDLVENANSIVFRIDTAGNVKFINEFAQKVFGFTKEEILDKNVIGTIVPATDSNDIDLTDLVNKILTLPQDYALNENENMRKDGSRLWVAWSNTPVYDEHGKCFEVVSVGVEITRRKLLEIELDKRRNFSNQLLYELNSHETDINLIENLVSLFKGYSNADGVGIRLKDGDDFPYYCTSGFSAEFIAKAQLLCKYKENGSTSSDGAGNTIYDCLCGAVISKNIDSKFPYITEYGSFWTNSTTQLRNNVDLCQRSHNTCNEFGYESIALIPILNDEEVIGIIQFNYYQTDRILLDFVKFIESIGRSVGIALDRLSSIKKLEQTSIKAEAASKAKSEFLAMMSHEIRTPLNGMLGFSSILEETLHERADYDESDEVYEFLGTVNKCGIALTDILNDILELSSIESNQFTIEETMFVPEEILQDGIEIFYAIASKNEVQLNFKSNSLPEHVIGDHRKLKQIIFNLVGNAIKFTHEGAVDVIANYASDNLLVEVQDTGIGISPDKMDIILDPFVQVDQSDTRKYGGTGLGLTIVSRILKNMNGSLNIESSPGEGSKFSFSFPAKEIPQNEVNEANEAGKREIDKNAAIVLAVEDDTVCSLYLEKILKTADLEYKIAASFAAMREVCNQGFQPGVVLLDIALPDADGFECLNWLKEKYPGQDIKYIAQTAHVLSDKRALYEEAGFDGFIGKPYKRQELLNLIQDQIKS